MPSRSVPRGQYEGIIGRIKFYIDFIIAMIQWRLMQIRYLKPLFRKIYTWAYRKAGAR